MTIFTQNTSLDQHPWHDFVAVDAQDPNPEMC